MFDDPKPDDIVYDPKTGNECTVREFNAMSKEEKDSFCGRNVQVAESVDALG